MIHLALAVLALHGAAAAERPLPRDSLYVWTGALEDQARRKVTLGFARGAPLLVTMVYGRCPAACPLTIAAVQRIEKRLSREARAGLRVLLVSMDPDHDTPEAMAEILRLHRADASRWRFARPSPDAVLELAALLGMHLRRTSDGGFSHSAEITLLDGEGVRAGRLESPADDEGPLAKTIEGLAATKSGRGGTER